MKLIHRTNKLKFRYRFKNWAWRKLYQELSVVYAESVWKSVPLVSYPLMIDINLGDMKFYFFKYGMKGVRNRIMRYNKVLVKRVGKNPDNIDIDQFYIKSILTGKKRIENQLNDEMQHLHMH